MSDIGMTDLKGHFLAAMPLLMDPNFNHTVTCICEYSQAGALGVVVNRLVPSLPASKIFSELRIDHGPEADAIPIYAGGPVHMNEIFILHGPPFGWKGTHMVTETLALSNTLDLMTAIAQGKGPSSFLIALGSAGWGPGQLDRELRENSWLTLPVSNEIVFETPVENRWEKALNRLGIKPADLAEKAGHA